MRRPARQRSASQPNCRVVALTTYADDDSIFGVLEAGAMGYLTKEATVKTHINNLFSKIGEHDRLGAVVLSIRHGPAAAN